MTIELYIYYPFCILKSSWNKGGCASVYKILTYVYTPSKDENLLLHVCVCHSSHSLKYSLSFNCTLNNYVIRPTYVLYYYLPAVYISSCLGLLGGNVPVLKRVCIRIRYYNMYFIFKKKHFWRNRLYLDYYTTYLCTVG